MQTTLLGARKVEAMVAKDRRMADIVGTKRGGELRLLSGLVDNCWLGDELSELKEPKTLRAAGG
jgi:hypothetical protein